MDRINYNFKNLEGKILVSSPHLEDPFFERTLVYICACDPFGIIFGVILNHMIGSVSAMEVLGRKQIMLPNQENLNNPNLFREFPLLLGGPSDNDTIVGISFSTINKNTQEKIKNKACVIDEINEFDTSFPHSSYSNFALFQERNNKIKKNDQYEQNEDYLGHNADNNNTQKKSVVVSDFYFNGRELAEKIINDKYKKAKNIIFARGLSAWHAQQLLTEIRENCWFIIEPEQAIISNHSQESWDLVVEKKLNIKRHAHLVSYVGNA